MKNRNIIKYQELAQIFKDNGFFLYLVGGSVRDYLRGSNDFDMDAVTDALPNDMKKFLSDADYTFEKYGSVKCKFESIKFDITTLREETGYEDYRHPNKIIFTNDINKDVRRRDLTVNALYLDSNLNVIDLVNGLEDLNNKVIRLIGNKNQRLIEDPLRIIRIIRFKYELGFEIEKETMDAVINNASLLSKLNIKKIKNDIKKSSHIEEVKKSIKELNKGIDL